MKNNDIQYTHKRYEGKDADTEKVKIFVMLFLLSVFSSIVVHSALAWALVGHVQSGAISGTEYEQVRFVIDVIKWGVWIPVLTNLLCWLLYIRFYNAVNKAIDNGR